MNEYNVTWEVTQEGLGPIDAAIQAAKIYFQERIAHGHPGTACIFYVEAPDGTKTEVALDSVMSQLDATQLRQVFETEHPAHDMDQWRDDVACQDTILGYWEWVQHQLEQERNEA